MTKEGSSSAFGTDPSEIAALMQLVLQKTGSGFFYQTSDWRIAFHGNLPVAFMALPTGGKTDADLFAADDADRLSALRNTVLATGDPASTEVEVQSPSGTMIYRLDLERIEMTGQKGVLSVVTDVSETRHRERVLKTLLRELSHRSKNLLAIIQGIATQTARQALSLDSFLTKFRGRIQSLASSQDLVTDSSWRGAYLFALAARQFSAYWSDPDIPFSTTGIDAHLSPNAALHIGLALHELIVNSASRGAIAAGANSVTLDCFETILDGQKAIELAWIETVPPTSVAHEIDEHTFARTVLERVVPIAIGGKASYLTTQGRIEYHLTIPAREYEIISKSAQ